MNTELISFALPSPLPGHGGWGNGYVAIPEGHPCFGMDYDQIHRLFEIDVNGGLTYAEDANEHHPIKCNGMWVVGFDTLHYGDDISKWPDEESVLLEANRLKAQLTDLVKAE